MSISAVISAGMLIDLSSTKLSKFWSFMKFVHVCCLLVLFVIGHSVSASEETLKMNMAKLRVKAFSACQKKFEKPVVLPIPVLDPPVQGGPEAIGMTFQEELEVRMSNILDRDGFYVFPKPRAALNNTPINLFIDQDGDGKYSDVKWEDANPDFSSSKIHPPIDKNQIPDFGKILTELVIGHRSPTGDYPQLFDIRSSAYVRFAGYPPQIPGASLRLGTHNLWSLSEGYSTKTLFNDERDFSKPEDFPILRSVYISLKSPNVAKAMVIVEGNLFCGALSLEMQEGENSSITVDGYWYAREDYEWQKEPNTGFVAYSSMLWKTEKDTPGYDKDEAHDTDTFRVKYSDGSAQKTEVSLPNAKLRVRDFTPEDSNAKQITQWELANEDRDPEHYFYFLAPLGNTNFDKRASYRVEILESTIKTGVRLYEHWTDGEYLDNIVAASTLREDIKKAQKPSDFVRFKYKTTAYFP